ncbi:hypothetical protein BDV35DRAFT_396186 [Aspergillus flavus]|uniref:Small EDRK-rich factor-like N-terminal domain-containing protein n=1 Tax=Aspergillus flavus TaxID=5059 RepID=A0A364LSF9_ASPFL|nr:hypothetical protein BDV35DRAFT_396186 [Aspergillus flavus]KAF7618422.1 hypothetical protein AFLA_007315 [Aspergillus flavus NRRL3357]KOC17625.1 hypothetical protein AFLA70_631g000651 [Aspergillus flavus AF70]KAJ1705972.1 hypothetical protein NYO67_11874 [Aspergillus flavus]RAQ44268.1 hypothetical protein AFGD_012050 [Aspergillus flavus]
MTRGNQRDQDRIKNQKKAAKKKTANSLSGTQYQQKKESDAEIMRRKQANADAAKAGSDKKK